MTLFHLKAHEIDDILEGALLLNRPVRRRRTGRKRILNCSIQRGHVAQVTDTLVVRAVSVSRNRTGTMWLIRLEHTGTWALPKPPVEDGILTAEHREQILKGATTLEFPQPLPVQKGDRFDIVEDLSIEIGKATPVTGKKAYKVAIKLIDLRPSGLLRASPPSISTGKVTAATKSQEEWARVDGAYTRSASLALGQPSDPEDAFHNDPGEGPPVEWKDKTVARRVTRLKEEQQDTEREKLEADARARLGRTLKGLTMAQAVQLLAYIEKGCELAEADELDKAA